MLRLFCVIAVLALVAVGVLAWSGAAQPPRADFAFINRGDNKSLDLNNMSWMQDIRVAYALWEGLYTLDPVRLKPIPGSAERTDISPDGRVYTFDLRPTARWSNGDPLRAQDFLFEWRRMLETPGEYTYLHHYIAGAEAYETAYGNFVAARSAGKPAVAPDFRAVGEKALDDHTLRVTLTNPLPFFPALCAFPAFFPMHEPSMRPFATTDPLTGQTTYDAAFTRPPHLVTNGPYAMTDWVFKTRLRMTANAFYWNRPAVGCRTIDQIFAEDPLAQYRLFSQGEVDWLSEVDPEVAAGLLKRPTHAELHIFPAFGTYFYEFNCSPKLPDGRTNPLADVRVRQALTMAIDKVPIVRDVGRLHQPITTDYIPPGVFDGYRSPPGIGYDAPHAQQLLASAGYPNGRGFPRLSILFNTESYHGDVATVIHRQWQNELGIDVDLEGVEVKVFGARLHGHDFAIARASWYGDYDDPSTFTDKYLSDSDNNNAGWQNPAYDKLCAAAALEPNPGRRFGLFSRAENLLLNDAPIAPLFTYVGDYLIQPDVTGISLAAQQMVDFKAIRTPRCPATAP